MRIVNKNELFVPRPQDAVRCWKVVAQGVIPTYAYVDLRPRPGYMILAFLERK